MMYRVLANLHDEITMSFLPVGHTKFSPDWCLSGTLIKVGLVGCLDDIVRVINNSASPNFAQLVSSQSGDMIVPMYDTLRTKQSKSP